MKNEGWAMTRVTEFGADRIKYGVYDSDHRMHAKMTFHSGYPCAAAPFPVCGGTNGKFQKFGDETPAFIPT